MFERFDISFRVLLQEGDVPGAAALCESMHMTLLENDTPDDGRGSFFHYVLNVETEFTPPAQALVVTSAYIERESRHLESQPERWMDFMLSVGMYLDQYSRLEEARKVFLNTLSAARRSVDAGEGPRQLYACLNAVAIIHKRLGLLYKAMMYTAELRKLANDFDLLDEVGQAEMHFNRGQLLYSQGELEEAEAAFNLALKLFQKIDRPVDVADTLYDLSVLYMGQRRILEAYKGYAEALNLRQEHLPEGHPDIALSLEGLGHFSQGLGKLFDAIDYYEEALIIYSRLGPSGYLGSARCLNNIGLMHEKNEDFEEAIASFEKSLAIYYKTGTKFSIMAADTLRNLGRTLLTNHDIKGMPNVIKAMQILLDSEQFTNFSAPHAESRHNVWKAMKLIAKYWNEIEQNINVSNDGIECLLTYKGNMEIDASLESLLRVHATGDLATLLARKAELKIELAAQIIQSMQPPFPSVKMEVVDEFADIERRIIAHPEAPLLADELQLRSIKRAAVQDALEKNEALLNYLEIADEIYAQILHADGTHHFQYVCDVSKVVGLLENLANLIRQPGISLAQAPELQSIMRTLGQTLLHPLTDALRLSQGLDTLVISGDRLLYHTPWDMLTIRITPEGRPVPLGQDVTVRQIPTPRDLVRLHRAQTVQGTTDVLLLGVQTFGDDGVQDEPDRSGAQPSTRSGLISSRDAATLPSCSPLPGTRREVELLLDIVEESGHSALCLVSPGVTDSALLTEVSSPFILHLATHSDVWTVEQTKAFYPSETGNARLDPAHPFSRAVILLDGYTGRGFQGIFRAWELASLPLSGTQLVTLSSCNSGLGDMDAGKAVAGLSQAAFLAGTQRTLTTLWNVLDSHTPEFMAGLYRRFLNGEPLQKALQQEKLAWMERGAPFSAYAPFVLNGLA
ncbi:CHAT domain-containing protein [Deinococcus yunweiensis]|uniref:CHAT domain-containing protein n=1 Tax=Deinococcus yunweiensis TaxID=367282 RepID=UPI00398E4073